MAAPGSLVLVILFTVFLFTESFRSHQSDTPNYNATNNNFGDDVNSERKPLPHVILIIADDLVNHMP